MAMTRALFHHDCEGWPWRPRRGRSNVRCAGWPPTVNGAVSNTLRMCSALSRRVLLLSATLGVRLRASCCAWGNEISN